MNNGLAGDCLGEKSADLPSPLPLARRDDFLHVPANSRLLGEGNEKYKQPGRAVFLDRDGVLIKDVNYLTSTDQIQLLPGVGSALLSLQSSFSIIVVTNQSGIARGFLTEEDLAGIHSELVKLLAMEGVIVDVLYYCPHLPEALEPYYRMFCTCRKPNPGMLLRAGKDFGIDLSRSFLVGDRPSDIQAGDAAGVASILLTGGGGSNSGSGVVALELTEAAEIILATAERDPGAATAQESLSNHPGIQRGIACQ